MNQSMPPRLPVYVVDDDDAVRDSLAFQIEAAGYEVKTFGSGGDFLNEAPSLPSGCVILDVRMPEMDGPEVQAHLNEIGLNLPVVMVTGHGDVALAVRAMKAGAIDFVEKPFGEEAILESIRLAHQRIASLGAAGENRADAVRRLSVLSPREREVLDHLVAGLPNKTVAYELNISQRTVEVHRASIMLKTQAKSLSELIRLALFAGAA
jgi:two-component system, LuxR family, response regulator FixJ